MTCGCAAGQAASAAPSTVAALFAASPYLTVILGGPVLLVILLAYPILLYLTPKRTSSTAPELQYRNVSTATSSGKSSASLPLPSLMDPASVQLTIVVPAYNERERLPGMLDDVCSHMEQLRKSHRSVLQGHISSSTNDSSIIANGNGHVDAAANSLSLSSALAAPLNSYEVIVVDDGSNDGTTEVALEVADAWRAKGMDSENVQIRVVTLQRNRGKGGAVRHGVMHSRGAYILFADADGATRYSDLILLAGEMERVRTPAGHGVVVGSRAHMVGTEAVVKRSFVRNFLMHSFHLILSLLMRPPSPSRLLAHVPLITSLSVPKSGSNTQRRRLALQPAIRDTQCGFKLFSRPSARIVFPHAHIERWIFDVELLLLAEMAGAAADVAYPDLVSELRAELDDETPSETKTTAPSTAPDPQMTDTLLRLALPIAEVPVDWHEIGGSKIDLLRDSIGMALDLCVIRANYALGRWERPRAVEVRPEGEGGKL